MKLRIICASIILGVCGMGCDDSASSTHEIDVLIFGTFYGYCSGERCVEIFALQNNKLYEDRNDNYPQLQSTTEFNFEQLDNSKLELVGGLDKFIPKQLLLTNSTTFGCPDCSDGGGVYIEIKQPSGSKIFIIDNFKNNIPKYLHPLVDQVHEKVNLLQ